MASFFHNAEAGDPLSSVLKHFLQYDTTFKTVLDVIRNSPGVSSFLIRAPAMTHRSVNKADTIRFFKSKDVQAGLYYLGRCEVCRRVMTSHRFQKCLDAWKASVFCTGLHICVSACVSEQESQEIGPTRSVSLQSVGCYYILMTTSRVWDSGRDKRHDPVNVTFMTCPHNVWGLSCAFQCSLGGVPRSPQDTTAHQWDGNFPFLVLPKLFQVFGKLWDSSQMQLLQPQQGYGSPGALWEMTNVPF